MIEFPICGSVTHYYLGEHKKNWERDDYPDFQTGNRLFPFGLKDYSVYFHGFVCCRSPPDFRFYSKNLELEEKAMRQKNNGKSESEILQNLFTAYLATAVQRRRNDYIRQAIQLQQAENPMSDLWYEREEEAEGGMLLGLPLSMQLEDSALLHALKGINERERHVFLARVLDERSFESLAEEMGLGYKGVATIYYRTVGKIKKKMKELRNEF